MRAAISARSRRAAFGAGWWFGFGFFVAGLYWLAWPLTLDLARFGWMIPFAVFGISAVLALFPGLAGLAVALMGGRGFLPAIVLALAWTAGEWLRGHLLTGFPWNLIATAWATPWPALDAMLQSSALWGAYGLGLVTMLAATLSAAAADRSLGRASRLAGAGAAVALLAALAAGGLVRLAGAERADVPDVRLRIVQGRVDQALKWRPDERAATLLRYIRMSRAPGFESVTHVIWPETAIAYRFQTAYQVVRLEGARLAALQRAVPERGWLITGIVRDANNRTYNSLQIVGPDGRVRATYDKHHLVPFGEYVPFRSVLASLGIEKIVHGRGDYSAGPGPATLPVPGAPPVSPLICYEAIFPAEAVGRRRPGWLLNVTNDAWFGVTSGPYQHFAAARLRAVEQGLPLVRAANSGISGVIDAHGRVRGRLGLDRRGIIDAALPRAAPPTLYARMGDWSLLLLMLALGGPMWVWARIKRV